MAVRFTRVFGLYTFFSVFLPGMMFLLGIAPIAAVVYASVTGSSLVAEVAANRLVTLVGILVFVTLGMFVGFGLHSLGAWFEKMVGDVRLLSPSVEELLGHDLDWMTIRVGRRHRKLFHEMLNGRYDAAHVDLVSSFIEVVNEQFQRLDLDPSAPQSDPDGTTRQQSNTETGGHASRESEPEDLISRSESNALYTLLRSQIHVDQSGRSRTFQAVFSACRSMFVAWASLTFAYTFLVGGMFLITQGVTADTLPIPELLQHLVSAVWVIEAEPPESENLALAFFAVVTVGFVGMYGFASVARNSKRYYLEYLVSDFLLLHRESDDEAGERSEKPASRPRFQLNR